MKNKLGVIIIASALALICSYFIGLTLVSNSIKKDAEIYATDASGKIDYAKKQAYLDSIYTKPVFEFLGVSYTFKELKDIELHLGLDLQGGMHVVMEVSPVEIVRGMAGGNTTPEFNKALDVALAKSATSNEKFTKLFYDAYKEINPDVKLSQVFGNTANKARINPNSSDTEILAVLDEEIEGAIDRSFQILRTRIDKFGVTQPNIQRLKGSGRIQLELPGVDDPERVRKLLQGTAKLEFVEVYEADKFGPYFENLNKFLLKLEKKNPDFDIFTASDFDTSATAVTQKTESLNAETKNDDLFAGVTASKDSIGLISSKSSKEIASSDSTSKQSSKTISKLFVPVYGGLAANVLDTAKVNKLFAMNEIRALLPSNMRILWAAKAFKADDGNEYVTLYFVKKGRGEKAALDGDAISDARQDFGQDGKPEVNMQMNANGAKKWRKITASNIGRRIAIVLDNYVYSAPVVQSEIPNGSSSISGDFTIEEAKDLANILKAGKLPAPTRIVEEAIVGPSLGAESISQGLNSTLIGLVAVIAFMIFYYSTGGVIADLALFVNLFFLVGILTQLQAVLTLPGIAGIVLTMGMAVDANVLIFERIREELREGRTLIQAINIGYQKANSSIVDGNVTTFLVGAILALYGSGPVQGFAVTLMIGIATSFFTSVFLTRLVFEWWAKTDNASAIHFSFPFTNNLFMNMKANVVGIRRYSYIFSASLIVIGFIAIFAQGGLNLGVDFKGGRSYVVKFDSAISAPDLRETLSKNFEGAGTEVKTFGANNQLKITTSLLADQESEEADAKVLAALNLGLEQYKDKNPQILSSSKVGATIADDIQRTSLLSILLSLAGIFIYILIRFRNLSYSFGAILALTHDVCVVIAFTGIAGLLGLSIEIDQVYIAAILTVVGYSINDTVVVFDRLREYLTNNPKSDIASTINLAINNTFSRTIITAITVFLVVIVLFFFGGEVLKGFSFVLITGVIFGSYSSIFIASPVVVDFMKIGLKKKKEVIKS
jgi:SecD/SecF fusion protein